ncbi:uncharacterized protein LY89DRAFT_758255 [Mollisia scopiformis]|uniref:F-box domain-containing protein n=1 Tax=Mollisia scopiformis TaxID=149040 RepID=A0A194WUB6_MOLSC|nr:uncharacterized protein LY89DRAFT_758255 [Mollisia scopiformis]KUJ11551.1 hypothetical protein LY89DRAFT_758255 [Mollisia scopiformis]
MCDPVNELALLTLGTKVIKSSDGLSKSKKRKERLKRKRDLKQQAAQQEVRTQLALLKKEKEDAQQPFRFLDLPYDIRLMIYNILYVRPVWIRPAVNFYRHRPSAALTVKYSVYRYQWGCQPQELPQTSDRDLPTREGERRAVAISWSDDPTPAQLKALENGATWLPDTKIASNDRSNISNDVSYGTIRISHQQLLYISGFFGVRLLRTCKQLREEGTQILYGDNKFCFDFDLRNRYSSTRHPQNSDHIPGFSDDEGRKPSEEEINRDLDRLFDKTCHHSAFVWRDPLLHFLTRIGPYNARILKSIKLSGSFKTLFPMYRLGCFEDRLPIYTTVLSRVCSNLCRLYIEADIPSEIFGPGTLSWCIIRHDTNLELTELSDHEMLYNIIGTLVEDLPQLTKLHLGWSGDETKDMVWDHTQRSYEESLWGDALEWVDIVAERAERGGVVLDSNVKPVETPRISTMIQEKEEENVGTGEAKQPATSSQQPLLEGS